MRNKRNILSEETRFTCWCAVGRDRRARRRRCVVEDKRLARRSRPTGNGMVTAAGGMAMFREKMQNSTATLDSTLAHPRMDAISRKDNS